MNIIGRKEVIDILSKIKDSNQLNLLVGYDNVHIESVFNIYKNKVK